MEYGRHTDLQLFIQQRHSTTLSHEDVRKGPRSPLHQIMNRRRAVRRDVVPPRRHHRVV